MAEKSIPDYNDLNEMVKEYLAYHGLESTLDCFKLEEKTKQFPSGKKTQ